MDNKTEQRVVKYIYGELGSGFLAEADSILSCCATAGIKRFRLESLVTFITQNFGVSRDSAKKLVASEAKKHMVELEDGLREDNVSIIVATTNNLQLMGNELLEDCGFVSTEWAERPDPESDEAETMVKVWTKNIG